MTQETNYRTKLDETVTKGNQDYRITIGKMNDRFKLMITGLGMSVSIRNLKGSLMSVQRLAEDIISRVEQ